MTNPKDNQSPHDNVYVDEWGRDWADEKARTVVEAFEFGEVECMSLDELTDMSLANQRKIAQALREAVAAETEACAKVGDHFTGSLWDASEARLASQIVRAIRDRKHG